LYATDTLPTPTSSSPFEGQRGLELVISASRTAELRKTIPQQVRVIGRAEIQNTNASTTADLLQSTGAAAVQKSQLGGGSPVLRGFEANRILLVVDGVRQNNLIFRSGHLQNSITLDANTADRIEILYGSGALMHGSDALGGVISLYTANPPRTQVEETPNLPNLKTPRITASAFTRYASAANETTIGTTLQSSSRLFSSKGIGDDFSSLTTLTLTRFGDQRKGANSLFGYAGFGDCTQYVTRINGKDSIVQNSDTNLQFGTGYSQLDVLQKIRYQATAEQSHTLNLQLSTSTNVPRYDRLQTFANGKPRFAEWYYGPQQRFMAAYHYQNTTPHLAFDLLRITPAYQIVQESRITRGYRKATGIQQIEDVNVFSLNTDLFKQLKSHELRYGAEITQQNNRSTANATLPDGQGIASNAATVGTRYPNADLSTTAFYISDAWQARNTFIIRSGFRFTHNVLSANFTNFTTNGDAAFAKSKQTNTNIDGSLGAVLLLQNGFRLAANIATGFRAPNVDDLGKTFEQTNGTIILPNPDLQPERTLQKEITLERSSSTGINIALTAFHTNLTNAIAVKPLPYQGADSITYNGTRYLAVANTNLAQAEIYGTTLSIKTPLISRLSANTHLTYTHGYDLTNRAPLDHIPPLYGIFSLKYQHTRWSAEAFTLFNGWKHTRDYAPTGEDNPDKATPDGTFAWYTLNLRGNYRFTPKINLQIAIENLFDANYRSFSSGINGAGRNFIATLRFQ
jgi:hemoglobin/transferrin/lactoferrin receptor protein